MLTTLQMATSTKLNPPPLAVQSNALFLDLDGTLFDLRAQPDHVQPDASLSAILRAVSERMSGALAVISGRDLNDADRILERAVSCVAGAHGQHCRIEDVVHDLTDETESWSAARDAALKLIDAAAVPVRVEEKRAALALHYRQTPEHGALITRIVDELAARYSLRAIHGAMVSELTPAGANKGAALEFLMRQPMFAERTPVAIGDDVTDEDAFRAANQLGGYSVRVGPTGESAATYRLPNVAAVRAWLTAGLS